MTTQLPDPSQLLGQLAAVAQPYAQQAAAQVAKAAQPATQQMGRDFGKGASEGAQWSNGTIAVAGLGAVAVLGLVGYAAYATGKMKPAMASGHLDPLEPFTLPGTPRYATEMLWVASVPGQDTFGIKSMSGWVYGWWPSREAADAALDATAGYGSFASDDDEVPTLRPQPRVIINDDGPATQRYSKAAKTNVLPRKQNQLMEFHPPGPGRDYWQHRPAQYADQPWPQGGGWNPHPGMQAPVHDRLTVPVPGLALEEPKASAASIIGIAVGLAGVMAAFGFVIGYDANK